MNSLGFVQLTNNTWRHFSIVVCAAVWVLPMKHS